MNKYIVKNCPALFDIFCHSVSRGGMCQDRTDCLIKQVIELCKQSIRPNESNLYRAGRMSLAVNIIDLFEMEECE